MQASHLNEKSSSDIVEGNSQESSVKSKKIADYLEIDYEDLELYETIGRGSYGSVFRGLWKSRNKIVAIKKLLNLENEADVLSSCSHRNIIQFYGAVTKASNSCIVTEYAEYGSLQTFISTHKELKLDLLLKLAHDIALGMNYLHSEAPHKIIHRDLKSNNVLIKSDDGDDYICKICDFGSSRFGIHTTKMSITGTFPWMSPEIIQSKPANSSCDIWSYGVVLWELLTGEIPFKGIDAMQIAFLVVFKEHRLPIPNGCPAELASLMQHCWQTDSKARPTFKQILTLLDQIDLDTNVKAEIDRQFKKNKPKWENEIEIAFEKLRKIEDDLHLKEKLLEEREQRLRVLEMEMISTNSKLIAVKEHDVNSWRENDVYEWIKSIGQRNEQGIGYCEMFLAHNINGKRLLMMDQNALRNIGITSVGHLMELSHEIEMLKRENIRLLNFPPLRTPTNNRNQTTQRTVSFNLLVGSHILITNQKPDEYKWKMFIDSDELIIDDDSNNNEIFNIHSYIRDVKFTRNSEQFIVHRPPFIMKHWSKGNMPKNINEESTTKINCTIIYDDKVIQPRKTTIEYQLNPRQQQQALSTTTLLQTVSITLEENEQTLMSRMFNEKHRTISSSTTSNVSSCTSTAIALISSNLQFQTKINSPTLAVGNITSSTGLPGEAAPHTPLNMFNGIENVWTKRNLENAVVIPENPSSKKSSDDLWAKVVAGKFKPNIKQISPSSSTNSTATDNSIKEIQNATVIRKNFSQSNLLANTNNRVLNRQLSGYGRGKPKIIDNHNSNSYKAPSRSNK